jgi:glutamyl-tRNA reductase
MSVLVVGLSHRTAPVTMLERAAVSGHALAKLLRDVFHDEHVAGTFVVSTCNRVEVYAEVAKFHAGVSAICELLARHSGIATSELTQHLYVHYEDRAVQHLLWTACGLESMVVGESQILGQVREALAVARRHGTLGRVLDDLGALALRAGKRAHAETGIDRAGANLVSVGIGLAAERLRPDHSPDPGAPLRGLAVLVVGAGSMSSLAVATAARLGAARIVVANRTAERAERLAAAVSGCTADMHDLAPALAGADLVISCTGAAGLVITAETAAAAMKLRAGAAARAAPGLRDAGQPRDVAEARDGADAPDDAEARDDAEPCDMGHAHGPGAGTRRARPLVLLDLALPRDVDPGVAVLPGVSVLGLESLQDAGAALAPAHAGDVAAVRAIVAEEMAARSFARHAARVAPTVVALRAKAAEVVERELARLAGRLGELDDRAHGEIALAMHRVVDKLLHAPTVRVKELAGSPGGDSYEAALRVLFDLDPGAVEAVTRADGSVAQTAVEAATRADGSVAPTAVEAVTRAGASVSPRTVDAVTRAGTGASPPGAPGWPARAEEAG